jgi:hypothetical protein
MADRFNSTSKELFSRVSVGEDDDGKTAEEVHGAEKKLDPKFDKPMVLAARVSLSHLLAMVKREIGALISVS